MKKVYTQKEREFIFENYKNISNMELAKKFNEKFNKNVSVEKMRNFKCRNGLKSGYFVNLMGHNQKRINSLFTLEEEKFIRENYKGKLAKELCDMLHEKFGKEVSELQINNYKRHYNLKSGTRGKGGFKKGEIPKNTKSIGAERVNSDGYTRIKVAEPNVWRLKHRVIWEQHNGKIPKGYCIVFANQDKTDIRIENLILVRNKDKLVAKNRGLLATNEDLTKTGLLVAKLINRTKEKRTPQNNTPLNIYPHI